jgi:hypothetical protein
MKSWGEDGDCKRGPQLDLSVMAVILRESLLQQTGRISEGYGVREVVDRMRAATLECGYCGRHVWGS